jgi:hypothetical protein
MQGQKQAWPSRFGRLAWRLEGDTSHADEPIPFRLTLEGQRIMGTKNHPGKYDCYAKADPDEPMFVLLARDWVAPNLVEEWARAHSDDRPQPTDKIQEAFQCAAEMRAWRQKKLRDAGDPEAEPEPERKGKP